jgi:hypothetical protein
MAWSRRGLKGMNAIDPISSVKQGPGVSIADTGAIESLVNFRIKPGAYSFDRLSGIYFQDASWDSDSNFNTNNMSKWFRDDGSTTT